MVECLKGKRYLQKKLENFTSCIFFRDGRLQIGDEVLMVNGQPLKGCTPEYLAEVLSSATKILQLVIARVVK